MRLRTRIERLETAGAVTAPKVEIIIGQPGETRQQAVHRHFDGPAPADVNLLTVTIQSEDPTT
jgi:hypothetical protein